MIAAFIGGKDFDPISISSILSELPAGSVVMVGEGMGLEKWVRDQAPELGLSVSVISKTWTSDINVEEVFSEWLRQSRGQDPFYVVGSGTRTKKMKSILKRATWPINVVEL